MTSLVRHLRAAGPRRLSRTMITAATATGSRGPAATVATMLPPMVGSVPTVDHLTSVERAAELMARRHVEALPVTRDDRVVGMFTERDYFEKVLNADHQAARSSKVGDVATMGPELVVAHPEDTVEGCLELLVRQNLPAMPVVQPDGRALGTVSVRELTRHLLEEQQHQQQQQSMGPMAAAMTDPSVVFSEPALFPENVVLSDGGIHDEATFAGEALATHLQPTPDAEGPQAAVDVELEALAADAFSEASVFPEYTPPEEVLLAHAQALGEQPSGEALLAADEREERLLVAHAQLLDELTLFSAPSDFPEAAPVDEVLHGRAAA